MHPVVKAMRWIEKQFHLSEWSLRPLPPRKVWGDRTMHAGIRHENVCVFLPTGAAKRWYLNLLSGRKSAFPPQG